jgi:hypothetical protein
VLSNSGPGNLVKAKIDDTLNEPNIHKIVIDGFNCSIVNMTGDVLDMNTLCAVKLEWKWNRIQSVRSWIYFPPKGPQVRQYRVGYFVPDTADVDGRYPSHPGYKNADWRLPVVERDKHAEDE